MEDTKENLDKLKKAYAKAVDNNQEMLVLDGTEILTMYAKYLIQHLEYKYEHK